MSDLPLVGTPAPVSAWKMIRAMVGIGLACGLLIVGVYEGTAPRIARNKAEALQRAVFRVLPDATSSANFRLDEASGAFVPHEGDAAGARLAYAGYDDAGDLVGVALEARGMGYADVIVVLYGYDFRQDAIVGIRVLESKETPGLGDRIETDPAFLKNFERLDVALDAAGTALANPIEAVKSGQKEQPWQVDGITGATISSVAIANMLRESAGFWVPRVRSRLDDFADEGGTP